ncbi:hypothetical protein TRVL_09141 [Trypanosoma vivax]|nr:hypothetical protein TRVL_09141 [Trypanosoma vivax]
MADRSTRRKNVLGKTATTNMPSVFQLRPKSAMQATHKTRRRGDITFGEGVSTPPGALSERRIATPTHDGRPQFTTVPCLRSVPKLSDPPHGKASWCAVLQPAIRASLLNSTSRRQTLRSSAFFLPAAAATKAKKQRRETTVTSKRSAATS